MRVLMIVPYYAPDLGPSAPLFTMLAQELAVRGHPITVITTVPHYSTGRVPTEFRGEWIRRSSENGVDVVRIGLPSVQRTRLAQRLLQFACYQLGATWAGMGLSYDVALVANPALWVWLPFAALVALPRKPAIFSVHDVYPDVGVKLGIFRNRLVIASVAKLERFCLDHASIVRILSDSFRPGLGILGVAEEKMRLVYDWVDTDLIRPLPPDNAFAREHGLVDRFVVLYAGNVGLSQGLEHVLTAAQLLTPYPDIRFVIVGDGVGKERLMAQAAHTDLTNVIFLPFQPRARLPEVLASADVSLVTLQRGIGSGSLPSKTFSILASGRPVLASVDEDCETWKLIAQADAGLCIPPETPACLAEAILTLRQDDASRERYGRNGRLWAALHHSPPAAAAQFEQLMAEAIMHTGQFNTLEISR